MKESIRMTEDRDKWRKFAHCVAKPTLGLRTAEEQSRTKQNTMKVSYLRKRKAQICNNK